MKVLVETFKKKTNSNSKKRNEKIMEYMEIVEMALTLERLKIN